MSEKIVLSEDGFRRMMLKEDRMLERIEELRVENSLMRAALKEIQCGKRLDRITIIGPTYQLYSREDMIAIAAKSLKTPHLSTTTEGKVDGGT